MLGAAVLGAAAGQAHASIPEAMHAMTAVGSAVRVPTRPGPEHTRPPCCSGDAADLAETVSTFPLRCTPPTTRRSKRFTRTSMASSYACRRRAPSRAPALTCRCKPHLKTIPRAPRWGGLQSKRESRPARFLLRLAVYIVSQYILRPRTESSSLFVGRSVDISPHDGER